MDIFKTNGIKLTSIADGTIDSQASPLSLPARNVSGYGKILNENLVRLLENFADITPPTNGLLGQLWFDVDDNQLYVNTDRGYQPLTVSYKTSSEPENPAIGDIWWDSGKKQLKVFDGNKWMVIGPDYESSWGETGLFSNIVRDESGIDHLITRFKLGGQDRLIINTDPEFVPLEPISGFPTIKPGITVSNRVPNFLYNSTVENSNRLGNIPASTYLRKDQDSFIDGKLTSTTVAIGVDGPAVFSIVGDDKDLVIANESLGSSINFDLFVDGDKTTVLSLDSSGQVILSADPSNPQSATRKSYVDGKFDENKNYIDSKFNASGLLPIETGGTAANTIEGARANLRVPSVNGIGATGRWDIDITGSADDAKNLNGFVESTNPVPDTIARRDSSGDLKATEFIGVATSARYADLAEKYLTDKVYEYGTVVMVGGEKEVTSCIPGSRAIGAISEFPAYKMNSELTHGQYVALKGRLKIKVVGPAKKGDMLVADDHGAAKSVQNNDVFGIFAVVLENNEDPGTKLVECLIL
jgi:hypothetical protein